LKEEGRMEIGGEEWRFFENNHSQTNLNKSQQITTNHQNSQSITINHQNSQPISLVFHQSLSILINYHKSQYVSKIPFLSLPENQ
jgi:hypothetical protein